MLRKWLLSLLGEKKYLDLLATNYQRMLKWKLLGHEYQDVYFLKEFIRPGDSCIDIGAHLGYFTFELGRLVGDTGHVYAIEPMGKFNRVIAALAAKSKCRNLTLYQYAMGGGTEYVEMGIPEVNKVKKFAYARIVHSSTHLSYVESERVKNVRGDELFASLPALDFIKCDVEGLEVSVFNSFLSLIERFRPLILCELGDEKERNRLLDLLEPFGYDVYYLEQGRLRKMARNSDVVPVSHNHYFIPATRQLKAMS